MRRLYSLLAMMLAPLAFAVVLWRGFTDRAYWKAPGERFGFGAALDLPAIWLHAVSLGEVTAAASLVRALRARHPERPLVLTTATPTGRARAHALFGDTVHVRYLPYDTPGSVRRFLQRVRPTIGIVMETELWPNLFRECARCHIPMALVSARLSPRSVARYERFAGLFGGLLNDVRVAAQSEEDAARFIAVGAAPARTRVVGNLKFDMDFPPELIERGRGLRAALCAGRPIWIAGSTHPGEEELVLTAHAALQLQSPSALLLLVPRHPVRFQGVADLLARRGLRFERRSSGNAPRPDTQVFLIDTVGELASLYAVADVAFVGGSLVPIGGHNLLEPAALGIPVITGPYQSNARDIARLLLRSGAALEVSDADSLGITVAQLLADPARRRRVGDSGLKVVEANRGTLARILEIITAMEQRPVQSRAGH